MACQAAVVWYKANTMLVQLGTLIALGDAADAPLTDDLTGAVITDAVVTAQLVDVAGTAVGGVVWPLSLSHVSGGVYRGGVDATVAVALGVWYVLVITATKAGNVATWRIPVLVQERQS